MRFSVRIVPNQTSQKVVKLVQGHIDRVWREMKSVNKIKVTLDIGSAEIKSRDFID